jgi:hypothetical protein
VNSDPVVTTSERNLGISGPCVHPLRENSLWNGRPAGRYPSPMSEQKPDPEETEAGSGAKLILTLFPFALVFLFLLVDWWIRGR